MTDAREPLHPDRAKDASGAFIPPPVIVAIVMLAGWGAQRLMPIALPPGPLAAGIALVSGLASLLLVADAARALRSAGTPINPWRPSRTLVTSGVFAVSRNPLYLSLLCMQASFAWWFGIGWWLVLVPASLVGLDRIQIRREERYLATTFGKPYADYQRRVGRWL